MAEARKSTRSVAAMAAALMNASSSRRRHMACMSTVVAGKCGTLYVNENIFLDAELKYIIYI